MDGPVRQGRPPSLEVISFGVFGTLVDRDRAIAAALGGAGVSHPAQAQAVVEAWDDAAWELADEPLEVERLSPVRDFVYRDDVTEGLAALGTVGKEPGFRVFNLSSGRAVSIGELARAVCRAAGLPETVGEKCPPGDGREDSRVLSIRRMMQCTRWRPAWTLEDGLARTLADMKRGKR